MQKGEGLAKELQYIHRPGIDFQNFKRKTGVPMLNLDEIKITQHDKQVLTLLVQGCSNKEIATQLHISPRTVKQHLRTLFLRAGIRDGRKRVKLATAMFQKELMDSCNHAIV